MDGNKLTMPDAKRYGHGEIMGELLTPTHLMLVAAIGELFLPKEEL
jgi:hypothetical protein